MEERNPVRWSTPRRTRRSLKSSPSWGEAPGRRLLSMYAPREYTRHKWGMSIDLNACTGCQVCTRPAWPRTTSPSSQGPVGRSREMHWIRVDTYYEGSLDNPETHHQRSRACTCEDAPCEPVCRRRDVHSDEA